MDAPGGKHAHENHGQREAEAERSDERKAERDFFELQAHEQNRERRRTRHESAGQAEQNYLRRGDRAAGKTLFDFLRVGKFVRILKISAAAVFIVMVMMFILAEFHAASVAVSAVADGDGRVKFMRLRDVRMVDSRKSFLAVN